MKSLAKLTTVTRQDLSSGYQTVQSMHVALDWAISNRDEFLTWHKTSNYLVALSVKNTFELDKIINRFNDLNINFEVFYEPDINEITGLCFLSNDKTIKITSKLSLANSNIGKIDKRNKKEI